MNHNESFAPVGGIQEMSFDEIDSVSGGWVGAVALVVVVLAVAYSVGRSGGPC